MGHAAILIDGDPWQQLLQSLPANPLVIGISNVDRLQVLHLTELRRALVADVPTERSTYSNSLIPFKNARPASETW